MVKEMRLAKVKTILQANALLDGGLLAKHNRLFSVAPPEAADAHRGLGSAFNAAAILKPCRSSGRQPNDYTVRFENRRYQLDKPIYSGQRGGKVVLETRLDGSLAIRFQKHYLNYHEIALPAGAPPSGGRSGRTAAEAAPTAGEAEDAKKEPYRPAADHPWRRGFRGKRSE